jgi:hypothetical protein
MPVVCKVQKKRNSSQGPSLKDCITIIIGRQLRGPVAEGRVRLFGVIKLANQFSYGQPMKPRYSKSAIKKVI